MSKEHLYPYEIVTADSYSVILSQMEIARLGMCNVTEFNPSKYACTKRIQTASDMFRKEEKTRSDEVFEVLKDIYETSAVRALRREHFPTMAKRTGVEGRDMWKVCIRALYPVKR